MEKPEVRRLRRKAHFRALARLAKEYPFEYQVCLHNVAIDRPELGRLGRMFAAQGLLREAFPDPFYRMYEQEKEKVGLPLARDRAKLAEQVVKLYQNGNGLAIKAIAAKLHVGQEFASRSLREAGLKLKVGRRRKKQNG